MIPKRLQWMAIGAGVSYASKWKAERSIAKAADQLEERLPVPVAKVANALPIDVLRGGGAVVVAGNVAAVSGRTMKAAAGATTAALGAAHRATTAVQQGKGRASERLASAKQQLQQANEEERRHLKSEYVRSTEGDGPALEALLDLRDTEAEPLPEMPNAVETGRRRFRAALPAPPVNRVQRSYRPPTKSWDRPLRRR